VIYNEDAAADKNFISGKHLHFYCGSTEIDYAELAWSGRTCKVSKSKSTDRYRIRSNFIEGSNEYDKKGEVETEVEHG
jgi:hypothetical protein